MLLGNAEIALGAPQAEETLRAALPLYREVGDLAGEGQVLSSLGSRAHTAGVLVEAMAQFREGVAALVAAGEVLYAAVNQHNLGEVLHDVGRFVDAREQFQEALNTFVAADSWYAAYSQRHLGLIEAYSGNDDLAHELMEASRARFEELGIDEEVDRTDLLRAMALVTAGSYDEALAMLARLGPDHPLGVRAAVVRAAATRDSTRRVAIASEAAEAAGLQRDPLSVLLAAAVMGREDAAALQAAASIEELPPWVARASS
jgi:tetratricopeptide (TPR) repeat protein